MDKKRRECTVELNGKTVMLVDDEPAILESLKHYLQRSHLVVTTAKCGDDALVQFRKKPFNIVVTDLVMPGVSGLQVLKEIKKCKPETGVYIFTGKGSIKLAIEALRLGADDFMEKPLDVEELMLKMGNYFEKQAALKRTAMYEKILPVCAYCKKIRNDRGVAQGQGDWMNLEEYFLKVSDTEVSHGCCPECYEKQMKELLDS
jgi:DNA-binding response OmpR family regulator